MNFLVYLLITLANVAICISLPKVLSLILAAKAKRVEQLQPTFKPEVVKSKTPSFPY